MAGLVVVYKTVETEAPKIVALLENRCLHPVVLDDPEKTPPYRGKSYEVRIAVPETERDRAVRILEQKERQEQLRLFPLLKRANAVFFLLMAVMTLLAVLLLLGVKGTYIMGFTTLVVAGASIALIRQAWGAKPDDSSTEKWDRE